MGGDILSKYIIYILMAADITYTFYADLGFYISLDVAAVDDVADTVSMTEETLGNAIIDINETISLTESDSGGSGYAAFSDSIALQEVIDARIRGPLKTLFISDERFFAAKPRPKIGER